MTRSILLFLFSLLALAPVAVSAQEPADTFRVDEFVVTATRLPTPRRAVPAAVTVLRGEDLRAQGIHFVADALRPVPGASVVRSGSYGGLTTAFLRGGEGDYVQVLVDGVVLNDPGGAVDLGQLTTDNIDRIEIVRGPVSVLYGSDAVTGVIQILTTRAARGTRVEVGTDLGVGPRRNGDATLCPGYPATACPAGADLGTYTTRAWNAALSGGTELLQYSLSASDFSTDGEYAFNNRYRNRSLSGRVGVGTEESSAAFTALHTDGLYHYPTDGAGRLDDRNVYRSSESLALGLEAGHFLSPRFEARAALAYHDGDYLTADDPDSAADTLGFYAFENAITVDRRKANLWGNAHLGGSTIATLGVEVEKQKGTDDFDSRSEYGAYQSAAANERSNRAVYAQLVAAPTSRLTATAGARTESNDRFGSFFTWRAGASARVAEQTTLRASAGTAFKEPTFFENYAEGFTVGNAALEPERSRSWEVGLEQDFLDGRVQLEGTWFDQRFRNLIQYDGNPAPNQPSYVNVGEASSRGLEMEARLAARNGGALSASWVHLSTEVLDAGLGTDALFQEGEPLIRRAPDRVNVVGSIPLGRRVKAGGALAVVSERPDLDFLDDFNGARVDLPGYSVLDLFSEVRLFERGTRDLSLRARVENVFDEDYQEIVNFPAAGRALSISLRAGTGF